MSAAEVLAELRAAGAAVSVESGGLRIRAAKELTPELLARARTAKPALLVLLAPALPPDTDGDDPAAVDLAAALPPALDPASLPPLAPAWTPTLAPAWHAAMGHWPEHWRDLWGEYAGRYQYKAHHGASAAERLAYQDVLEAFARGELTLEPPSVDVVPQPAVAGLLVVTSARLAERAAELRERGLSEASAWTLARQEAACGTLDRPVEGFTPREHAALLATPPDYATAFAGTDVVVAPVDWSDLPLAELVARRTAA